MDGTQVLTPTDPSSASTAFTDTGCPRCGTAWGALPAVNTHYLRGIPVRRCIKCAARFGWTSAGPRRVLSCRECAAPILQDTDDEQICCVCCRANETGTLLDDPLLVGATETEVREALSDGWHFVSNESVSGYLNRIARQIAHRVEGAPTGVRVGVFQDAQPKSLALPSGVILISVGLLSMLDDEAELAFVLGQELVHVAKGHASPMLMRLAFNAVSDESEGPSPAAWRGAAEDLMALGYGIKRGHDCDTAALTLMLEAGYDPASATRFLSRVQKRIEAQEIEMKAYACAHASPSERRGRIERQLNSLYHADFGRRVNREPFRRAAGIGVLASRLELLEGLDPPEVAEQAARERTHSRRRFMWTAIGIAALAVMFLVLGLVLSR